MRIALIISETFTEKRHSGFGWLAGGELSRSSRFVRLPEEPFALYGHRVDTSRHDINNSRTSGLPGIVEETCTEERIL